MLFIADAGKTPWPCKSGIETNIVRIEVRDTQATFEPCICSLRSAAGGQNEVINIEGFKHHLSRGLSQYALFLCASGKQQA